MNQTAAELNAELKATAKALESNKPYAPSAWKTRLAGGIGGGVSAGIGLIFSTTPVGLGAGLTVIAVSSIVTAIRANPETNETPLIDQKYTNGLASLLTKIKHFS